MRIWFAYKPPTSREASGGKQVLFWDGDSSQFCYAWIVKMGSFHLSGIALQIPDYLFKSTRQWYIPTRAEWKWLGPIEKEQVLSFIFLLTKDGVNFFIIAMAVVGNVMRFIISIHAQIKPGLEWRGCFPFTQARQGLMNGHTKHNQLFLMTVVSCLLGLARYFLIVDEVMIDS